MKFWIKRVDLVDALNRVLVSDAMFIGVEGMVGGIKLKALGENENPHAEAEVVGEVEEPVNFSVASSWFAEAVSSMPVDSIVVGAIESGRLRLAPDASRNEVSMAVASEEEMSLPRLPAPKGEDEPGLLGALQAHPLVMWAAKTAHDAGRLSCLQIRDGWAFCIDGSVIAGVKVDDLSSEFATLIPPEAVAAAGRVGDDVQVMVEDGQLHLVDRMGHFVVPLTAGEPVPFLGMRSLGDASTEVANVRIRALRDASAQAAAWNTKDDLMRVDIEAYSITLSAQDKEQQVAARVEVEAEATSSATFGVSPPQWLRFLQGALAVSSRAQHEAKERHKAAMAALLTSGDRAAIQDARNELAERHRAELESLEKVALWYPPSSFDEQRGRFPLVAVHGAYWSLMFGNLRTTLR